MTLTEVQARLSRLEQHWSEGSMLPALFEAVDWCRVCQVPLPDWANLAVLNLIIASYGETPGRTKTAYRHYLRWVAVENQIRLRGLETLPGQRGRPGADKNRSTKDSILEAAAKTLSTNPETKRMAVPDVTSAEIERSYRMVKTSRERGESRFRFEDLLTI